MLPPLVKVSDGRKDTISGDLGDRRCPSLSPRLATRSGPALRIAESRRRTDRSAAGHATPACYHRPSRSIRSFLPMSESKLARALLAPACVALVGASADPTKN